MYIRTYICTQVHTGPGAEEAASGEGERPVRGSGWEVTEGGTSSQQARKHLGHRTMVQYSIQHYNMTIQPYNMTKSLTAWWPPRGPADIFF